MSGGTIQLTEAETNRLQNCSICDKEKGIFVCQSEKCANKDKLLYCQKCGRDNHAHGAFRIQNLQNNKVVEWQAIQAKIEKIDGSSKSWNLTWKEPIELLEKTSQNHNIKPVRSIYEDIYRFNQIKRESDQIKGQIG